MDRFISFTFLCINRNSEAKWGQLISTVEQCWKINRLKFILYHVNVIVSNSDKYCSFFGRWVGNIGYLGQFLFNKGQIVGIRSGLNMNYCNFNVPIPSCQKKCRAFP